MRFPAFFLALFGLAGCRKPAPAVEATAPSTSAAPIASAAPSAPPGASIAPPPAPTSFVAYRLDATKPPLTVLVPTPGDAVVLLNEKAQEWLVLRGPGDRRVSADGKLALVGDPASGTLALQVGEGAPRSGKIGPTLTRDEPTYAFGTTVLDLAHGFALTCVETPCVTLRAPKPVNFGAVRLIPQPFEATAPCAMRGLRPALDPPNETFRAAIDGALARACRDGDALEVSFSPVVLAGTMGAMAGGPTLQDPSSTRFAGLTLLFRATGPDGSTTFEVGHVVELPRGELTPLKDALKPDGAGAKAVRDQWRGLWDKPLPTLRPDEREQALDLEAAAFSLGPTTFDLVVPTSPYGIFLPSRRVNVGSRSELVNAFRPGPMAERITRPLLVDF